MKIRIAPTRSQRDILRSMAEDMLTEANERGDLDWDTVSWAVNRLLSHANKKPSGVMVA